MSYQIEKKYANTNSMTVAQAEAYYGKKFSVTHYFTHWWSAPQDRAKSPVDIYDYMVRANKSVRHILGWDDKLKKVRIIAMTPEERVPLTQQGGNIYGDSVEVDPLITTSDPRAKELYKALGWLMWQREKRWKRRLRPALHKEVWATACSDIDKAKVQLECDRWRDGYYTKGESEMPYKRYKDYKDDLIEIFGKNNLPSWTYSGWKEKYNSWKVRHFLRNVAKTQRKGLVKHSETIKELRKALENEQNKPPEVVIKEVEKIVEKETIVEVPVGEEEAVRGFFGKLLDLIFKKN